MIQFADQKRETIDFLKLVARTPRLEVAFSLLYHSPDEVTTSNYACSRRSVDVDWKSYYDRIIRVSLKSIKYS